jgi:uncharacterized protein (DUF433 family)
MSYMTKAFSLRMDDDTHRALLAQAERAEVSPSKLVNRYVKEGLRMDEHPAIAFISTPQGRRAVLAARPRLQVIDVVGTWKGERQDIGATAKYFGIDDEDVRAVIRYYVAYKDELDDEIRRHLDAQQNYKRLLNQREAQARRRVAGG